MEWMRGNCGVWEKGSKCVLTFTRPTAFARLLFLGSFDKGHDYELLHKMNLD